jgi:inosine-uridine nucleoside N-ribohydrolase
MRKFLALALLLAAGGAVAQRTPIILDTDIGVDIDDAMALALALQWPELDVRAVTTVLGDTQSRTRLAWKELGLYGRHDVAVAAGASQPLLDNLVFNYKAPQFNVLTVTVKCELTAGDMARLRDVKNSATEFLVKLIEL